MEVDHHEKDGAVVGMFAVGDTATRKTHTLVPPPALWGGSSQEAAGLLCGRRDGGEQSDAYV